MHCPSKLNTTIASLTTTISPLPHTKTHNSHLVDIHFHTKPGLQSVAALSQRNFLAPHWPAPLTRHKCSVNRSLFSWNPTSTSVSAMVSVALQ